MKLFLLVFFFTSLFAQNEVNIKKPDLFLLNKYKKNININSWYMSEKLDGVRAYWDGKKLISRSGKIFSAPAFFTKDFPSFKLDGELWSKRGDFSNISSIVNRKKAHDAWSKLSYNIFEVPEVDGNLLQRLQGVKTKSKYIKVIKQIKIKDQKHLNDYLKHIENLGGEGVVVRDGTLSYYTGRNNNALKVKSFVDAECKVLKHNKGKGKNKDRLGSISCLMQNKLLVKIGSGFSDEQRDNPPKIGAIITFKYYGLTSKGKPRFPVFLRIRN